jgi:DNA (cytosine-5)-methyltransferase 1
MNTTQIIEKTISPEKFSLKQKPLKVISLFSGCGGKDLGFIGNFTANGKFYKKLPYEIIWANDIWKDSCNTYAQNISPHIICEDIENIDIKNIPEADVVIGGFPCQDFSVAGKRRGLNAKRGRLFFQMLKIVKNKQPKAFIAENVKGLVNIDNGEVLKLIKAEFTQVGYTVSHYILKANDFGIPQTRERVIIVGIRNDINTKFSPPKPTKEHTTSKQAIDDLWGKENENTIPNHNQFSKAKKNNGQGNKQIKADMPSPTIRAEHHGNIEFHYRDFRRLTVRECARLQSFPDNFIFLSSGSSNYKQVGNAVPPVLGWHIANALAKTLGYPT